ncbi:hypothetical protein V8E53_012241 [Lactarius tabidus]
MHREMQCTYVPSSPPYPVECGAHAAEQKLARYLSSAENGMSTRFLCFPADGFKSSKGAFRETISLSLAHATSTQPAWSTSQVGAGLTYVQVGRGSDSHNPVARHVTSVTAPAWFFACAKNAELLDGLLGSLDFEEFVFRQWIGLVNTLECITPKVADSLVAKGHNTKTESRGRAEDGGRGDPVVALVYLAWKLQQPGRRRQLQLTALHAALHSNWHDHRTPGGVPNSPNYPHQSEKNSWIATGTGAATVPWRMAGIQAHKGVVVLAKRGQLVVRVKT